MVLISKDCRRTTAFVKLYGDRKLVLFVITTWRVFGIPVFRSIMQLSP